MMLVAFEAVDRQTPYNLTGGISSIFFLERHPLAIQIIKHFL